MTYGIQMGDEPQLKVGKRGGNRIKPAMKERKRFSDGVECCTFEWSIPSKFRPVTHVCALELNHRNCHVCRCGISRLKRKVNDGRR
jgi:hypothetical protein